MNPKTVLKYATDQGAKFVSVRFTDLPGSWQHLTFPISELGEDQFEDGFGFDASSIRGWAAIHESDMNLMPDPESACIDPFYAETTLVLVCDTLEPLTGEPYNRDPRSIARKTMAYLGLSEDEADYEEDLQVARHEEPVERPVSVVPLRW